MTDLESQRGRQAIVSTGRGGAGNLIRSASRGVDPEAAPGIERGRELHERDLSGDRAIHSGRGGAGNIRSPSRDPSRRAQDEAAETALQERLIADARGRQVDAPFSTGRGGAGNFTRDKSRSRSQAREKSNGASADGHGTPTKDHAHHAGRGGWGNITEERHSVDKEKDEANQKYEAEIAAKHKAAEHGKMHSSGKGGFGNITNQELTEEQLAKLRLEEHEASERYHKDQNGSPHYTGGGRGGAGNYHLKPDGAAAEGERGRDAHKTGHGLLGNVMRSLSRATQGRDKSTDRKD